MPKPKTSYLPTFEVDKEGLRKVLARRGIGWIVPELIQNCWDEDAQLVTVTMEVVTKHKDGTVTVYISVEDDVPNGFADLAHAYTLFAESAKKTDAQARGRFNVGEKLVVAACDKAIISTTTGCVVFSDKGREIKPAERERGSLFQGFLRTTWKEFDEAKLVIGLLIPPSGVSTFFNGEALKTREPIASWDDTLPTVIGPELRMTQRKTRIEVYEPLPGEEAVICELGIPVVAIGDRWSVNIAQKIPLNIDRDNVTPAYLRDVRRSVLNHTHDMLTEDAAAENWTLDAASDSEVEPEALDQLLTLRFGEKRVSYDPSDPEANKLAVSEGYTVIGSRSLPKAVWQHVRKDSLILPAGQVTPSPKPYSEGGKIRTTLPPDQWSDAIKHHASFVKLLGRLLFAVEITVEVVNDQGCRNFSATYRRDPTNPHFEFNLVTLGRAWFEQNPFAEKQLSLVIHELGHQLESDHLSRNYYDALTTIGARLTKLVLLDPERFAEFL